SAPSAMAATTVAVLGTTSLRMRRLECGIFLFERGEPLAQRSDRLGNLLLREAWRDVLRAVPVECLQPEPEDPLRLRLGRGVQDALRQRGVRVESDGLDMPVDLEPRAARIIHQDQRGAVVGAQIAEA